MAERYVRARVRPEYYPAVAEALIPAIKDVLGEAATDVVLSAWGEAYWFLADTLIHREAELSTLVTVQDSQAGRALPANQ